MQSNADPHTPLAGQNVKRCSHLGNSLSVPQNVGHRVTIRPSNSTPRYICKRNENICPHKLSGGNICKHISKKGLISRMYKQLSKSIGIKQTS